MLMKENSMLPIMANKVYSMCVSPDGKRIVSGSLDKTVKVWDAITGKALRTLTGHTKPVLSVCVSQDGTRIVSGSDDKTVKVWDFETGHELRTIIGHTDWVRSVCVTNDGTKLVTASQNEIIIWDFDDM